MSFLFYASAVTLRVCSRCEPFEKIALTSMEYIAPVIRFAIRSEACNVPDAVAPAGSGFPELTDLPWYSSTRFPMVGIVEALGKPLFERVIEVIESPLVSRTWMVTVPSPETGAALMDPLAANGSGPKLPTRPVVNDPISTKPMPNASSVTAATTPCPRVRRLPARRKEIAASRKTPMAAWLIGG